MPVGDSLGKSTRKETIWQSARLGDYGNIEYGNNIPEAFMKSCSLA